MSERVFERKIYQKMLEWKKESNGKTALLIKGARRVGKSTIAEEFAKKEYSSYILIDFSIAPKEIHELFQDLSDLNYLFLRLQLIYHVNLEKRNSVKNSLVHVRDEKVSLYRHFQNFSSHDSAI